MINRRIRTIIATGVVLASSGSMIMPVYGAVDSSATYYYTTDGTTPSASNGSKWDGVSKIQLTPPDTDLAQDVVVKVIGEKAGAKSDVVSTTIHYDAKTVVTVTAPIIDPSVSKTYSNRETDNQYYITNVGDTGVSYYYKLSTPADDLTGLDIKTTGTLISGKNFSIDGPDQDSKISYKLNVVAEKDGILSEVKSVGVTFSAKVGSSGGDSGVIIAPSIVFNKLNPLNRDSNVVAIVGNKLANVEYHYTLNGTDATIDSDTLSNSFIKLKAPDVDTEENIMISVKGFKAGLEVTSAQGMITYQKKLAENKYSVVFKDRTYNDIETVIYDSGESMESKAPTPPEVPGYTFLGWSTEQAKVNSDMIVRALYERDEVASTPPVQSASYVVINNGTESDSYVQVGNAPAGSTVKAYLSSTEDTPVFSAVASSTGECTITIPKGNFTDDEGEVYMEIGNSSKERSSVPRVSIKYPSRAVAQAYSLPILASRLHMEDSKTLVVRGIDEGEVVNVYDKDNVKLGTIKQGKSRAVALSISLNRSVESDDIYVARIQPSRLESQQTELNKSIIEDQLNGEIETAQTVVDTKALLEALLVAYRPNNDAIESEVKTMADGVITNSTITATISEYKKQESTDSAKGNMSFTVTYTDSSNNDTSVVNFNKDIDEIGTPVVKQTIAELKELIAKYIGSLSASNSTDIADIQSEVNSYITNSSLSATVNLTLKPSTEISTGLLSGSISLGDSENTLSDSIEVNKPIDKLIVSSSQTLEEAKQIIQDNLASLEVDNKTTSKNVIKDLMIGVTNNAIIITIPDFNNTNSTEDSKGKVTGTITLQDGTTYDLDMKIDKLPSNGESGDGSTGGSGDTEIKDKVEVVESTDADLNDVAVMIQHYLDHYVPNNRTDKDILEENLIDLVDTSITTPGSVHIDIADWKLDKSSQSKKGLLQFIVNLTNEAKDKAKVIFVRAFSNIEGDIDNGDVDNGGSDNGNVGNGGNGGSDNGGIGNGGNGGSDNGGNNGGDNVGSDNEGNTEVEESNFKKAVQDVSKYLDNLKAKNSTSKSKVKKDIEEIGSKYGVVTTMSNWELESSTKKNKGSLEFDVTIHDDSNDKTLHYEDSIAKKSSSSSSSSSKDHDSDSDSKDNDKNNTSNNNNTTGSNTGNSSGNSIVDSLNGSKGDTNSISGGSTAEGNSTNINDKDGNYSGSIVEVSKGGTVSINNGGGNGGVGESIGYLYKYESVTGKYILMPQGLQVTPTEVSFQAQAGTRYYVSTQKLTSSIVLNQGWNVVNGANYRLDGITLKTGWVQEGANWYYVDTVTFTRVDNNWRVINGSWYYFGQEGLMATNWVQSNGNWYYLDPWSGIMATGWKQVGTNWYYLHQDTGAMQTGWHKIGYHWFYMHTDGHMASSEVINGYNLDSDGRWY